MTSQREHDFLVTGSHDDFNRQSYIANMRLHILQDVSSVNSGFAEENYVAYVVPDFYCVTEGQFEDAITS